MVSDSSPIVPAMTAWALFPAGDPNRQALSYAPKYTFGLHLGIVAAISCAFFLAPVRRWTGVDPVVVALGNGVHFLGHAIPSLLRLWRRHPRLTETISQTVNMVAVSAMQAGAIRPTLVVWSFYLLVVWIHGSSGQRALFAVALVVMAPWAVGAIWHLRGLRPLTGSTGELLTLSAVGALVYLITATTAAQGEESQRQSQARARVEATAAERERIARELHGTLGAALTEVALWHEVALGEPGSGAEAIGRAQARTRAALGELRSTVAMLDGRSVTVDELGEQVRARMDGLCRAAGLRLRVRAQGMVPLDGALAYHLGKFVEEAVTNAAKHAHATCVEVELSAPPVAVRVADDGAGFDPGLVTSGQGLDSLDAHARGAGGMLAVDTAPGRGTRMAIVAATVGEPGSS